MALILTLKDGQRMILGGDVVKAISLNDGSDLTRVWFSTGESNVFIESPDTIYAMMEDWELLKHGG
jgi:hypothetical protein